MSGGTLIQNDGQDEANEEFAHEENLTDLKSENSTETDKSLIQPQPEEDAELALAMAGGENTLAVAGSFMDGIDTPKDAPDTTRLREGHNRFGNWTITGGGGIAVDGETVDRYGQKRDANGNIIKEDDEEMRDALDAISEQAERERQWDEAMSADFDGMTNAQVLDIVRLINKNPQKYADDAARKGLIRDDQKDEFIEYMSLYQQNLEHIRKYGVPDPALVGKMDKLDAENPNLKPAIVATIEKTSLANSTTLDASTSATTGAVDVTENYAARDNAYSNLNDLKREKEEAPVASDNFSRQENKVGMASVKDRYFTSAPDLTIEHAKANAATVPLDNPPQLAMITSKPSVMPAAQNSVDF